jgi:SepF-like predicted cell division protein (DUF552 family)
LKLIRNLMVALAAVSLTACVSTPPNALKTDIRDKIFIQDVNETWAVVDGKRADNADYLTGKADLEARIKTAVETEFKASPSGSEAARFEITVKSYSRVNAAMGNMIGGANIVVADVRVVRVSDGAELGVYKDVTGMHASNGGLIGAIAQAATKPDIVGIMTNTFAANLRARFDSKK